MAYALLSSNPQVCQNDQDDEGANLGKATDYTLIDLTAPPHLVKYWELSASSLDFDKKKRRNIPNEEDELDIEGEEWFF